MIQTISLIEAVDQMVTSTKTRWEIELDNLMKALLASTEMD